MENAFATESKPLSSSAKRIWRQMLKADGCFLTPTDARSNREAVSELLEHLIVTYDEQHTISGYTLTFRGKKNNP